MEVERRSGSSKAGSGSSGGLVRSIDSRAGLLLGDSSSGGGVACRLREGVPACRSPRILVMSNEPCDLGLKCQEVRWLESFSKQVCRSFISC